MLRAMLLQKMQAEEEGGDEGFMLLAVISRTMGTVHMHSGLRKMKYIPVCVFMCVFIRYTQGTE